MRVIISNVCPIIPHFVIEDKIKALDVIPASQITCIRASINEPEYAHVMSFRRQVYINPEEIEKLPESMEIEYDNTKYWIYFSNDKAKCFLCKEEGHLAKQCQTYEAAKNTLYTSSNSQDIPNEISPSIEDSQIETQSQVNKQSSEGTIPVESHSSTLAALVMPPPPAPGIAALKRSSNLFISTQSTPDQIQSKKENKNDRNPKKESKRRMKRLKKEAENPCSLEEIETQIASAKNFFLVHSNDYPLEFEGLTAFLKESYGNPNHVETAQKFTADTPGLVKMLRDAYPHTQRRLKSRMTRIVKKLESPHNEEVLSSTEESDLNDSEFASISENGDDNQKED